MGALLPESLTFSSKRSVNVSSFAEETTKAQLINPQT